jgi:ComF family protein
MAGVWTALVDLLYPPRCAACEAAGSRLCAACASAFVRLPLPVCAICGDPLVTAAPDAARIGTGVVCAACGRESPAFSVARSVFVYGGPLRSALHALKYRGRRDLARPLGALLATLAPADAVTGADVVVPVPLHPARLAARGFNQAELLARPLATRLGLPLVPRGVRRVRQEMPQVTLDAAARRGNVARAFAPGEARLRGRVLLVDDVASTGSTASACARALREAGASSVAVVTLARALLASSALRHAARLPDHRAPVDMRR